MAGSIGVEISLADQGLSGAEALEIRSALEDQIESAGIGEIVGGGCATDGSGCDFEVKANDIQAAEEFLRGLLEHCGLLDAATIQRL
jgi:hypothetical protein